MISEVFVVKSIRDFLISEKEYTVWVDSRFAAEIPDLEPTHQIRIGGRIPDILARKKGNIVAIECKGERESGRQILEAIGQVVYYKKGSHQQYIGCPESLMDDTIYDICNYLNVGIITVNDRLEANEELKPAKSLVDEELLETILELTSFDVDIKPIPNINFSRPEPFIIATLLAGKIGSYKKLLESLMSLLPSRSGIGCSEGFARKVIDTAISLRLIRKRGDKIFLTRDGASILYYFMEKCGNIDNAISEICALYKPKIYNYKSIKITKSDIKFIARFALLKHPTVDFLTSLLMEMREKTGKNIFTFKEIFEFAKNEYPEKTMIYLIKASCEKKDVQELTLNDIDPRICDDIKAQMRNAGIIKGKQRSTVEPDDIWEICL